MGILDRLKSLVSGSRDPARLDLRGPLGLAPGDGVGYYRERFTLAGVRRLDRQGPLVWHYCLRARDGSPVVLVVEEGPDASLWLERPVAADLRGDQDVIEGVADEPFRIAAQSQSGVVHAGDTDGRDARSVRSREFRDAEGERRIVVEDWGGRREVRVGEPVHEAELTFARAGDGHNSLDGADDEGDSVRGTPGAAAAALVEDHAQEDADRFADDIAREDVDPTAFDDEHWDEEESSDAPQATRGTATVEAVVDSEEDEWRAASRYIREHGIPAEPRAR